MNIYLIERDGLIDMIDYDEVEGFVIAASSEDEARDLAKSRAACEGKVVWETAPCKIIGTSETLPKGVVMTDFRGA